MLINLYTIKHILVLKFLVLHLMERVVTDQQESSSKSNTPTADSGNIGSKSTTLQQSIDVKATNSVNSASGVEKLEEKPSSSETRPKEGNYVFKSMLFCLLPDFSSDRMRERVFSAWYFLLDTLSSEWIPILHTWRL